MRLRARKPKIIKEILSPLKRAAGAVQEKTRATQTAELKGEIRKREEFIAPDGTADVTNPQAQMGRCLMRDEVVRKLQKLNPNLMYEQSKNFPQFGGLYIHDYSLDDLTAKPVGKLHLCGFPHEAVSEFDVRLVVNSRVPDPTIPLHWIEVPELSGHIPGWRSTIKKLVDKGIINLAAAEKEFEIYKGRSSQKWQQAVN